MRKTRAGMCGLLVAFASISAYAQWVPVTANIRFTNEVIKDGQSAWLVAREGVFYRTENGSTLNHWTRGDLDNARGTGELFDNQALATYQIFYDAKKMVQTPAPLTEPRKPGDGMEDLKSDGTDSVGGIQCDLAPVRFVVKGKTQDVGHACVARNYGLLLKQETRYKKPDGTVVRGWWVVVMPVFGACAFRRGPEKVEDSYGKMALLRVAS
jgi:hypothetical protein